MRLRSPDPDTTRRFAACLGGAIDGAGALVLLRGPLGAGKTHFAKGLAEGLGIPGDRIQSPTFVIAHELPLASGQRFIHVDCYRIGSEAELEAAGLLDWLAPGAVVVVEWADRLPGAWPADRLEVAISRAGGSDATASETARELEVAARGGGSQDLLERWQRAWTDRVASLAPPGS